MAKKNSVFDTIIPAALAFVPGVGPELSAAYTGIKQTVRTGNPLRGLESAGLSYAGQSIGSGIGDTFGQSLGTVGSKLGTTAGDLSGNIASSSFGNIVGAGASNAIGSAIANQGIGSLLGGYAGNTLASSLMPQYTPKVQGPTPFAPKQADAGEVPGSLAGLSTLTPEQQSSNVANKGVFGGGNGPEEQAYFTNLINRRLVDQSGKVGDINQLSPVDNSYLSQLGLGGYGSSQDLLQALTKWKPS